MSLPGSSFRSQAKPRRPRNQLLVYGLLVQDVFGAPSPNGAFWSIAVEAQLYLLLPLGLLILRKTSATVLLIAVLVPVLLIGIFAPSVPTVHLLTRFTPQFAVGFTLGTLAAGVVGNDRWRRYPWHWLAMAAAVPVLALIFIKGSVWTVEHYFWVDLAHQSPAIALLLAAIATRKSGPLVWFLDTRPIRSLGGFSYSLYLVHRADYCRRSRADCRSARDVWGACVPSHSRHWRTAGIDARAAVRSGIRPTLPTAQVLAGTSRRGPRTNRGPPSRPTAAGSMRPFAHYTAAGQVLGCGATGSSEIRAGELSGGQDHSEPVVVEIAEAAGDPVIEFDDAVDGLGSTAVARSVVT